MPDTIPSAPCVDANSIAQLVGQLGERSFAESLLDFLRDEVDFDSRIVLAYPGEGKLEVIYQALPADDLEVFNTTYREGLWSMSPLFLSACSGFRGAFHIQDLAPEDFELSRFYKDYWSQSGINDQIAYIAQMRDGTPLVISMERTHALTSYTEGEKNHLKGLSHLVSTLVGKNWESCKDLETESVLTLRRGPTDITELLGGPGLTAREKEVTELLVLGHSNKIIGRKLGISHETVKVHCRNINEKLGVTGRSDISAKVVTALLQKE